MKKIIFVTMLSFLSLSSEIPTDENNNIKEEIQKEKLDSKDFKSALSKLLGETNILDMVSDYVNEEDLSDAEKKDFENIKDEMNSLLEEDNGVIDSLVEGINNIDIKEEEVTSFKDVFSQLLNDDDLINSLKKISGEENLNNSNDLDTDELQKNINSLLEDSDSLINMLDSLDKVLEDYKKVD